MSLRKILFVRYGENITTELSPLKPYNEETDRALLEVTDRYCFSYDDNRLVTENKYELREIDLPDWLSTEDYTARSNYFKWNFILAYTDLCEKLQEKTYKIYPLEFWQISALGNLFKVKSFRSDFRRSVFNQVCDWLSQDNPKYRSPLSDRQWSAIGRFIK